MNTQPLEIVTDTEHTETEIDMLLEVGFSEDEIISLRWLQQWYQHGGSDRMEVLRHLEFLKLLVVNGRLDR
jgi:hypothetical protein